MNIKILITGPPRCGKSTLVKKLIDHFTSKGVKVFGFLTPEIMKDGNRIGFDVEEIHSKKRKRLARRGNYDAPFKLGRYCVFLEEFNEIISQLETVNLETADLLVIDEIGKMELFSEKFQIFVREVFQSDHSLIATIGQNLNHPIKKIILKNPEISLFTLERNNQQEILQKIISIFD